MVFWECLYVIADVLPITASRAGFKFPSCELSSSVKPSLKYSSPGSPLRFSNGNTTSMSLAGAFTSDCEGALPDSRFVTENHSKATQNTTAIASGTLCLWTQGLALIGAGAEAGSPSIAFVALARAETAGHSGCAEAGRATAMASCSTAAMKR